MRSIVLPKGDVVHQRSYSAPSPCRKTKTPAQIGSLTGLRQSENAISSDDGCLAKTIPRVLGGGSGIVRQRLLVEATVLQRRGAPALSIFQSAKLQSATPRLSRRCCCIPMAILHHMLVGQCCRSSSPSLIFHRVYRTCKGVMISTYTTEKGRS